MKTSTDAVHHLVMTAGSDRAVCGVNLSKDSLRAMWSTADALLRANKLGAGVPGVCHECYVGSRPA